MIELPVIRAQKAHETNPVSGDAGNRPPERCHLCYSCKTGYQKLIEDQKVTDFTPMCELSSDIRVSTTTEEADLDDMDQLLLSLAWDPVEWAKVEFNWVARWYQEEVLRCTSQYKILRMGRRTGKSTALAINVLHKAVTRAKINILIITPYQEQTELIFKMIEEKIDESSTLKGQIFKYVRSPSHTISFKNGSQVKGMTAGVKTGSKASKVRGQDADVIAIDEADMLSHGDLESILAIMVSHPHVELWISGTPTGKREFYYKWSTDPTEPFKAFHFPSSLSPGWNDKKEKWLRSTYSESGYIAEFEADFPVLKEGVFPLRLVDEATSDYNPDRIPYQKNWLYGVGVDWNDTDTGANIILLGYNAHDQKFYYLRKWVVSRENFTQLSAVEKIIEVNQKWSPSFIYVDAGFGATQVELLHKYGMQNPNSGLLTKVKAIEMGGKIVIQDPYLGEIKKHTKPFIVGLAVRRFEQGQIALPACERRGEGTEGLVDQIYAYKVVRYTTEGRPIFSNEGEHLLTAWILALYGFWMEHTTLAQPISATTVSIIQPHLQSTEPKQLDLPFPVIQVTVDREKIQQEQEDRRMSLMAGDRGFELSNNHRNMGDAVSFQRTRGGNRPRRIGFSSKKRPFRRSTF